MFKILSYLWNHFKTRVINDKQGILPLVLGALLYGGYKGYQGHQDSLARKKAYVPEAPQFKQAPELFESAIGFGKENYPYEFGSRESALQDIATPESTTDYYSRFQPTSMEEALGNQYFQNVYPDAARTATGALSNTGLEYSPLIAKVLGELKGKVGFDVGSYLSEQGGRRAETSLDARLQFDPRQTYDRYLQTDITQSGLQEAADYQRALDQAAMDYWKATGKAEDRTQTASSVHNLLQTALSAYNFGGSGGAGIPDQTNYGRSAAAAGSGGQATPVNYTGSKTFF